MATADDLHNQIAAAKKTLEEKKQHTCLASYSLNFLCFVLMNH